MRRRPRRLSNPVIKDRNPARGPIAASPAIGHNSRAAEPPLLPSGASCARCQYWSSPSERETQDYEAFRLGLARRRVKEPSGACDRVLLRWNGSPTFAATVARSRCFNFAERETPLPVVDRRGFVTIYENGRIVWQGTEGDEPANYWQAELDI
ncbi:MULTISPECIES: hypothetical protein [Hyphomicrobiales]|jgi:hypothetical protein|uniref:hypothetical protein n=1 Tax=Hyphomicrobiales TaxID=356 RepID=UPI0012FF7B02|nr:MULTISPECIES: hypothetical protein [Hyphomicrobiales]MDH2228075.1 hypothetical protein [Agrobacterium sp. GD03642]